MKIYCIGDSLVYGYGVKRYECWVSLLAESTGFRVLNYGVNGDTTTGIMNRLYSRILPAIRDNPEEDCKVLLVGGYNDIFISGSDSSARENMMSMLTRLRRENISASVIIPCGIASAGFPPEWEETVDFENAGAVIESYDNWLKAFCAERQIPYVDLRDSLCPSSGRVLIDGIHPTAASHRIIMKEIKAILHNTSAASAG